MAVVGAKEVDTQTVTVRSRFGGELRTMNIDDFISRIKSAIDNRTSLYKFLAIESNLAKTEILLIIANKVEPLPCNHLQIFDQFS
ncbi:hypothetical protein Dsin_031768 [Dipteronia sinensis]|uniref:Anticodon-binding domain-containing protein n=1 Tax=Dipteronia sinensis TaxID=43782 RepID=A0AAD9ZM10_9ROSI|nr:hypothetical protein Dsin_031768 [Dipteronia sinensis]